MISAVAAASRTAEAILDNRVSVADLLFRLDSGSSDTYFLPFRGIPMSLEGKQ